MKQRKTPETGQRCALTLRAADEKMKFRETKGQLEKKRNKPEQLAISKSDYMRASESGKNGNNGGREKNAEQEMTQLKEGFCFCLSTFWLSPFKMSCAFVQICGST